MVLLLLEAANSFPSISREQRASANNFKTNINKMSRINLYKAPSPAHVMFFIAGSLFTAGIIHGSLLSSGKFTVHNFFIVACCDLR